jgi:hypothetical protein
MLLGLGGSGGAVDLTADGSLTVTGTIDIRSTAAGGDGGIMTVLTTSGSITLGGKVFMQGDEGTDAEGGGNGGELNVFSAAGLTLSTALEISGAPPDGQGGDVFFMSVLDTVQTGTILAQGRGAESDGGSVEFESHKSITLRTIDTHGGEALPDSGGAVQAVAWCDLTVPSGVVVSAEGDKGNIHLLAGGQLTTTGSLRAGSPILLEYRTLQPITAGGTFLPELATPLIKSMLSLSKTSMLSSHSSAPPIVQSALQPSPSITLPSSHSSGSTFVPLPQPGGMKVLQSAEHPPTFGGSHSSPHSTKPFPQPST